MPAKKTRQEGKAVYLLSADRKFRRLSLKKISERVKEARRSKRGRSMAKATTVEPSSSAHENVAPAKVASAALAVACLFLVTTLGAAWWFSTSPASETVASAQPGNAVVLTADVSSAPVIPPVAAANSRAAKAPAESSVSPASASVKPTVIAQPTETAKPRAAVAPAPPPPAAAARSLAPAEAQPAAVAASVDTVTVSGCLDFDGKSAWLKNTSGVDAPKTRSWRSGFLRKSAPRIALVDGPASVETYDGRQVSVTGVLVDREMHVSSVRPIADNCE